ncbi:MAG: hypothetical protein JNM19_13535 [Chitinophagaceae bacterium]|nr:hypothetical protein [Chitinophagaceae bacterium]
MPGIWHPPFHARIFVPNHLPYPFNILSMTGTFSKRTLQLIIVLLLLILLSAVWVWYGVQLKKIELKKENITGFAKTNSP